jgi:hypothetical protein
MAGSLLTAPMELSDTELDAVAAGTTNSNSSENEGVIVVNLFSGNQNAGNGDQQVGLINV